MAMDHGDWDPAWWITCLGKPSFHEFSSLPAKEQGKDKAHVSSEDGFLASSVDPRRSLTARQIKVDAQQAA
jgi:hypothetical protein